MIKKKLIFGLALGIIIGIPLDNSKVMAQSETFTGGNWLAKKNNWNQVNSKIPTLPQGIGGNNLSNCQINIRQPQLPEDKLLQEAGWTLTNSAQIYAETTVIMAMADADGMCRPLQYQVFVFNNGVFIGTLSPTTMDSRTDGSIIDYQLYRQGYIDATFARYSEKDAMCCPSQKSRLFYKLETINNSLFLVPMLPAKTLTSD